MNDMDLILGQYSNGDISVTSLTVTCMVIDIWWQRTASYILSKFVQVGSRDADGAKTKTKTKVVKVTRPPPCLSPGSWEWRKQMSATDNRLQFTGDKNWQKTKHLHFLDMRVLNDFLLWTVCEIELTCRNFRLVNLPWAKLAWNWDCVVSFSEGKFWESHIISRNRFVTKKDLRC